MCVKLFLQMYKEFNGFGTNLNISENDILFLPKKLEYLDLDHKMV